MGTEQIRECSISYRDEYVIVTGKCKKTYVIRSVKLLKSEFDEWKSGVPLSVAAPLLDRVSLTFLNTGVWSNE